MRRSGFDRPANVETREICGEPYTTKMSQFCPLLKKTSSGTLVVQ